MKPLGLRQVLKSLFPRQEPVRLSSTDGERVYNLIIHQRGRSGERIIGTLHFEEPTLALIAGRQLLAAVPNLRLQVDIHLGREGCSLPWDEFRRYVHKTIYKD